jgi:hypothetical protein
MIKRLALIAVAMLLATQAHAVEWLCSADGTNPRGMLSTEQLRRVYTGRPVLLNRWVTAVILPADHPDTERALVELFPRAGAKEITGMAQAIERMATTPGVVDVGIVMVQSPRQVIQQIAARPPAVGYVYINTGGDRDVAPCF